MPSEVPFNQSLKGSNFYGNGILLQRPVNLNTPIRNMDSGTICDKQPIKYNQHEKVSNNIINNFEKYTNESVENYNNNERSNDQTDRGLDLMARAEGQNLDFDADGMSDMDLMNMFLTENKKADEAQEKIEEGKEDKLEEKSLKTVETDKPEIEPVKKIEAVLSHIPTAKPHETPLNELKSNTAFSNMKTSDMVSMGVGAVAMLSMFMGRN